MHKTLRPFKLSSTPLDDEEVAMAAADDSKHKNNQQSNFGAVGMTTVRSRPTMCYRRYAVGEYVLISNHNIAVGGGGGTSASTLINPTNSNNNLVNRYGFPEWDVGMYKTFEQRRGPYLFVLAKVVSVHFGEDAQYYTVRREDTMENQRADVQFMEPMLNQIGIDAAKIAAKKKWVYMEDEEGTGKLGSYGVDTRGSGGKIRPCMDSMTKFAKICHRRLGIIYRKV